MKKILFLCFALIATVTFSEEQTAELRIYDGSVMFQRFMGVVQQDGDNYVFIHRSSPTPQSPIDKYAAWRLISLQQDLHDFSTYHLGSFVPANEYCIVPFVNGIMCANFVYDAEHNTIQFRDGDDPDRLPEDYKVSALVLLNSN